MNQSQGDRSQNSGSHAPPPRLWLSHVGAALVGQSSPRCPTCRNEELKRARWTQGHVEVERGHENQAASSPVQAVQPLQAPASLVSED